MLVVHSGINAVIMDINKKLYILYTLYMLSILHVN